MPAPFRFDRSYRFGVPLEDLWAALADTTRYPQWFPWLERADLGLVEEGTVARFGVRPPLPYRLGLEVHLDRVVAAERIEASVEGDLRGPASLEVAEAGDGASTARVRWALELQRPLLVAAERVARPALEWGHDAVVAIGVRRFRRAVESNCIVMQ